MMFCLSLMPWREDGLFSHMIIVILIIVHCFLQIEIKMKKVDGTRWAALEGDGEPPFVKANLPGKFDKCMPNLYKL